MNISDLAKRLFEQYYNSEQSSMIPSPSGFQTLLDRGYDANLLADNSNSYMAGDLLRKDLGDPIAHNWVMNNFPFDLYTDDGIPNYNNINDAVEVFSQGKLRNLFNKIFNK